MGSRESCGRTLLLLLLLLLSLVHADSSNLHLTTTDEGYLTVIQGFATQLQCVLNTCSPNVVWYKDDVLVFNGTQFQPASGLDKNSFLLQHKVQVDYSKGCSGSCSDSRPCGEGRSCVDNTCCPCTSEDFSLILKNLTFDDQGRYRCALSSQPEQLEFQVEVLESGLKGGFHENISYDHSECCEKKGISPLCQAMCKPSSMDVHHFDPTSCKTDDYKNFLSCATNNGSRNHVHCCRTQLVPSFCYDFCSGNFQMLRRSHRLCLYYLPEIFECYNRAYLPYPDPPEDVEVNAVEADKLSVCWKAPLPQDSNRHLPITLYTVFYKQIPNFPFLGGGDDSLLGGIPLLTEDYADHTEDYAELEHSETTTTGTVQVRRKRQTWVFVSHDSNTNTTTSREFKFSEVNTTDRCVTLHDLRSATRYMVYVVSHNEYGASLPSERSIASTNVQLSSANATIADAMQCCKASNVSSYCSSKMCDVNAVPSSFTTISIATSCRTEWPKVSPCIADGRNHTECCLRKNVQHECLKICSGEAEVLPLSSILCLNFDLPTIYQCLREGYETHPSPPINVTVDEVGETEATIRWDEPLANAHLVTSYSLFLRKSAHGAPLIEVKDVVSPHTENGLDPDSEYTVSLQSHSENGTSLPSTAILFTTHRRTMALCPRGEPIFLADGRPLGCDSITNPCPSSYYCFTFPSAEQEDSICCPNGPSPSLSDSSFAECCKEQEVVEECLPSCSFNSTLDPRCGKHLDAWIRCASEGRDHSRCCEQKNLPSQCLDACHHPFHADDSCIDETPLLLSCFARGHSRIPFPIRNLQISSLTSTSVDLLWEAPISEADIYEVQLFSQGQLLNRTNVTTPTIAFSSLSPNTHYESRVIVFTTEESSSPSFNLSFSTLPSQLTNQPRAPTNVRIAWNYGTRVNISWQAPTKRLNDEAITALLNYSVFYSAENEADSLNNKWTETPWVVLGDLKLDEIYKIYVETHEGETTSPRSAIITLIAQPDVLSLPQPVITLSPDNPASIYDLNDEVRAECSVPGSPQTFNLDLYFGLDDITHNEPGSLTVQATRKLTSESLADISCAVTATDGRENYAERHIFIRFGPEVKLFESEVKSLEGLSAVLRCEVRGFPPPEMYWEFQGQRLPPGLPRTIKSDTFEYVFVVSNVTGRAGEYTCVADREGQRTEKSLRLTVDTAGTPEDASEIHDCCVRLGVDGDCAKACSPLTAEEKSRLGNCSTHAESLLKCASDIHDHSDCCLAAGVPNRCRSLCAGDSVSPGHGCEDFAVPIIQCVLQGHAKGPKPVEHVFFKRIGPSQLEVTWDEARPDENEYYIIFYRKKGASENETMNTITKTRQAVIEVDTSEPLEVGVIARNPFGFTPLEMQEVPEFSSSGGSSFWPVLIALLLSLLLIGIVFKIRRDGWPGRARPLSHSDPTVAFENPGYGSEVEIRGLHSPHAVSSGGGGGDWTSADLQPPGTSPHGRYAKLDI